MVSTINPNQHDQSNVIHENANEEDEGHAQQNMNQQNGNHHSQRASDNVHRNNSGIVDPSLKTLDNSQNIQHHHSSSGCKYAVIV